MNLPQITPSELVALINQTLEFAYPLVEVEGEVLNFKVSKNRWVYFDIADESAKIRCFGTVYILPAPVEDGMRVKLIAAPRLHPQFGFSLNLQSLQFSGEGTIKKAADLLAAKLDAEGLFSLERKRPLPYPPATIGLITSDESAAYKDFIKVLNGRLGGLNIQLANVQVQGEAAVGQIARAIEWFNAQSELVDVLVITRGGGSADDLQAFSSEQVTRAVAASRIPTLVAIGHEVDVSLSELAADQRASTPSNAAELLVPDRKDMLASLQASSERMSLAIRSLLKERFNAMTLDRQRLAQLMEQRLKAIKHMLELSKRTIAAYDPRAILSRGYAVVRSGQTAVRSSKQLYSGDKVTIQFADGQTKAQVE